MKDKTLGNWNDKASKECDREATQGTADMKEETQQTNYVLQKVFIDEGMLGIRKFAASQVEFLVLQWLRMQVYRHLQVLMRS
jgi:hypothetical protein